MTVNHNEFKGSVLLTPGKHRVKTVIFQIETIKIITIIITKIITISITLLPRHVQLIVFVNSFMKPSGFPLEFFKFLPSSPLWFENQKLVFMQRSFL